MKTKLLLIMVLILVITSFKSKAQQTGITNFPLKSLGSVAYGTDVLIQGSTSEDQRSTKIVVASNGYLYAAYMISGGGFRIAKSTDDGSTWTYSSTLRQSYYINSVDIAVTGADAASINVWVITSAYAKASIDMWDVTLQKFNQNMAQLTTTQFDQMISNEGFPDVAIATDYGYQAAGATPFSIGIIYSKVGAVNDHVIFKSSADGGSTFANTQILASTGHYFINVSLAFGRSPALPEGRYFAAWDKQAYFTYTYEVFGQVYTAHSLTQFDGSWSTPARLDNIGLGLADASKNPTIACQADQVNNSSSAFSVVVMFERLLTASGTHTYVFGAGNLNPVGGSNWLHTFSSGSGNIIENEPDVTYDQTHQRFYVTWCDSLNAKLKCSVNDMNLQAAGSWSLYSDGYNDAANLVSPFPKVKVNPVTQQLVHVWDSQRSAMIANATFDKSDFAVSTPEVTAANKFTFSAFPNPFRIQTNLAFNLNNEEVVSASVYDLSGRQVLNIPAQSYPAGNQKIELNMNSLEPACYIVQLHAGKEVGFQRIVVIP
jgi:hypothetical protein